MRRIVWIALALGCMNARRSRPEDREEIPERFQQVVANAPVPARAKGEEAPMAKRFKANAGGLSRLMASEAATGELDGLAGIATVGAGGGRVAGLGSLRSVKAGREPEPEAPRSRAWFPETFLFDPLVVTDADGAATTSVRVPDRLTSWRVLALAHSRAGAQAGAETTFEGTLPTYVDPVVPSFLMVGDEVALPIQVVNNSDAPLAAALKVELEGATLARAPGPVRLGGQHSQVAYALVRTGRPGAVTLRATLGGHDEIERRFPVRPTGRPIRELRAGTLAAPRALDVALPADTDEQSASARLQVFPGALAVLRAELAGAVARGEPAGDAYALLLAGRGAQLVRSLGGEPDEKALRALAIITGQRAVRATRAPDVVTAALFTEPALSHPDNPVLSRLGERLLTTVAAGQRPDGTFAGADGWTLQRLLVTTAACVRAVRAAMTTPPDRQRATRVTLQARAAFERNLARVEDAYTAAALLASGALDGGARDQLRARVRKAIRQNPDGSRALPVDRGVVRADGEPPTETEATALAVLGLHDDPAARALLPDLGARLLSSYDPAGGFGDGHTNLVALSAVLALFAEPLPAKVTITFTADGKPLAERVLEGPKLREVLVLETALPAARGTHHYELRAEPAVPGLGYALALDGYVPWSKTAAPGLELAIEPHGAMTVGHAVDIDLQASAPAGRDITIRHALPAGVQVDGASLDALVSDHTIVSYEREEGAVTLHVPARQAGQAFSARYRAVPTLAGKLNASASRISVPGLSVDVPPTRWVVK